MDSTGDTIVVQNYLQVFGIEPEATIVYIALLKIGPASALQIAKQTSISRTQTYRHLEELKSKGLVSNEQLNYGSLFRALPFENVEGLIASREAETRSAQHNLSAMTDILRSLAGSNGPAATVHHYYGLAGLKQVNWNLCKSAIGSYKVFEAAHLSQHMDVSFAQRCRERRLERDLTTYDLTNDTTAKAKDLEPFAPDKTFVSHIDPEILTISFEAYIYNDVVTLLDYSPDQQMAIEIHHPALSRMMTQLFDAMWNIATPIEIK